MEATEQGAETKTGTSTPLRRLYAKIVSGTDALSLERAINAALSGIPLAARPSVSMIAPLGDRVRLYAIITYEASGADVDAALKAAEDRRKRMNINYETLK
jgi:hypothetical protein